MALASTLLALPVLCLVSIPLILSAWITVSLALATLFVRLSVVYIGVGYDMLVSFFTLPISTISFLNFAASHPPTPVSGRSRRNSAFGILSARRSNDSLSNWALNGLDDAARYNKKISTYARNMAEAHYLPAPSSIGLPVSGDEWRDFEGVGGWRSYHNASSRLSNHRSSHSGQEKSLSPASSSSAQSISGELRDETDVDADDRDWLLLNHRLELPSQVFKLRSAANSPTQTKDTVESRRGSSFYPTLQTSAHNSKAHNAGHKNHHRRSQTTSSLPHPNSRTTSGLPLSLSNRPEARSPSSRESDYAMPSSTSRIAALITPQLHSGTQTRSPGRIRALPMNSAHVDTQVLNTSDGFHHTFGGISAASSASGGYFSLQRPGSSQNPLLSPGTSGYTTPGVGISTEDRDASSLPWTRLMAHYPTSVRHRRRSISGPHARRVSIGERLA